jgi:hypothetical protein
MICHIPVSKVGRTYKTDSFYRDTTNNLALLPWMSYWRQVTSMCCASGTIRGDAGVSPCGICGGQSHNGAAFPASYSVFPCQYHSTGAPYSYIIRRTNSRAVGGRSLETQVSLHRHEQQRVLYEYGDRAGLLLGKEKCFSGVIAHLSLGLLKIILMLDFRNFSVLGRALWTGLVCCKVCSYTGQKQHSRISSGILAHDNSAWAAKTHTIESSATVIGKCTKHVH